MQLEDFIVSAYAVTLVLIAALCAATWHGARAVKRQLDEKRLP